MAGSNEALSVLDRMREVADELGDGWTATPGHWDDSAFLHGPDHVVLSAQLGHHGAEKDRLIVSIHYGDAYQRVPSRSLFHEGHIDFDPNKTITVSPTRTSTQIAREITRRLLPDAIPAVAWVAERQAAWEVAEAAKQAELDRLATIWGRNSRRFDSDFLYGPHLSQMHVRHNAVTIEAHQVPYEAAEKIAAILAESAANSE